MTAGPLARLDGARVGTWALSGGLVLYLAFAGGGYDIVVRSQAGLALWWLLLVGATCGLLPRRVPTGAAWTAVALFAGFLGWSALASTWSLSSERSLQEVSRLAMYLAVLALAISIHRDREHAVRDTTTAIALAVVIVAAMALLSRLIPNSLPSARITAAFLPGTQARLGWPLNYWNALGALVALGLPLVLTITTTARRLSVQAAGAATIPALALCGYLTFSRGAAIAAAAGLLTFLALSRERAPKLATILAATAASAVPILAASHGTAVERGLSGSAAARQGAQVLIALVLACGAMAIAQAAIGLAARRRTASHRPLGSRARALLIGGTATLLLVALLAGAPAAASRAWGDFKKPPSTALRENTLARFATANGNGRYEYWKVALHASGSRLLSGSGPGTYQLLWQPRAPYFSSVVNAHSLYLETLAETGIVGLALLAGFLVRVLTASLRSAANSRQAQRTRGAGATAAMIAFLVSAIADWVWQMPVLPVAFLLLVAAILAPAGRGAQLAVGSAPAADGFRSSRARILVRAGTVAIGLPCLAAIVIPLATTTAVRRSETAAAAGNAPLALADARAAARLEPGAASPQLQIALILELQRDYAGALAAARRAAGDEPANWSAWLVLSRLEAESGNATASLAAYRRARSLNPRSPLFEAARQAARSLAGAAAHSTRHPTPTVR
jgi:O-Antigen ligase